MNFWQRASSWIPGRQSRSQSVSYPLTDSSAFAKLVNDLSGGVSVNVETTLSLATVYRCVDLLSSSVASLPWDLYETDGSNRKKAVDHPVYSLLKVRPHRLYTSFIFRKTIFSHALLWGNGYAHIKRNGVGRPVSLKIYHPREVTPLVAKDADGEEYVFYQVIGVRDRIPAEDMLHIKLFSTDGIVGRSVIRQAAEGSIKTALQGSRFINALLASGGRPSGIIKVIKALTDPALKRLKANWFSGYTGDKTDKVAVLDEGMDYVPIGVNPVDAQLLEMMKLSREDICALFGVPQHLASILDKATFSNIEHQDLEYVKHFLRPHLVNLEEECNYKLLRLVEQGRVYCKLNLNGLLRGDLKSRKEYYQTMINCGVMNANEVRELEDMNPYEGGERYYKQGAMIPVDKIDDFIFKRVNKSGTQAPAQAA